MPEATNRILDEVLGRVKQRGTTLVKVAKATDIPYNTLRSWLERNKLPPEFVEVARFLGMGDNFETLRKTYGFQEAASGRSRIVSPPTPHLRLSTAMEELDDRLRKSLKQRDVETDISVLLRSMQQHDILVVTTLEAELYETMRDGKEQFGPALRHVVDIGAHAVYVRPDVKALKRFRPPSTATHVAGLIRSNHEELKKYIGSLHSDSQKRVGNHIHFLPEGTCNFWMPGVVVGGFLSENEHGRRDSRVYIRILTDDGSSHVVVKTDNTFRSAFVDFARTAIGRLENADLLKKALQNFESKA